MKEKYNTTKNTKKNKTSFKVLSVETLDNNNRVKINVNRILDNFIRGSEHKVKLDDGFEFFIRILSVDQINNCIEAKKFSPAIYVWTTKSYVKSKLYKVGLVNWQSVSSRLKQTDTTGVLEPIELVEIFELNVTDQKMTHKIESEIHNRLDLSRKDREGVIGNYKKVIRPVILKVIEEFKIKPNTTNINIPTPRYYQKDAADIAKNYYEKYDRGWIQWFCRTGKSNGSFWIYESIYPQIKSEKNLVLILVPSRQLVVQTHDDWVFIAKSYGRNIRSIKIGGVDDSLKDVGEISRWINHSSNDNINLIVSTYQSSEKISQALKITKSEIDLTINDEVHKLTGNDTKSWKRALLDSFIPSKKRLSMTASPIEYTTSSVGFSGMENKSLFGEKFHEYTFLDAQFDGYIVPMELLGIEVSNSILDDVKNLINKNKKIVQQNLYNFENVDFSEIETEVNVNEGSSIFFVQLHNTLVALKNKTFSHPIIYANSKKRIRMFLACLKALSTSYGVKLDYLETFTSEDKIDDRIRSLNVDFPKSKIGVVGNVYCLSEGITIPVADAVVMIDPRSSGPSIIQTTARPLGFDPNNKSKIAKILLPIILERNNDGKIILNETYFSVTRDWIMNICASDKDLENLLVNDLRFFTEKIRQGVDLREVLPSSNLPSISGKNINLDRREVQIEIVDFKDYVNESNLSKILDTKKSSNILRSTESGQMEYLNKQAISYVLSIKTKVDKFLENYDIKNIKIYSKVVRKEDEIIEDFSKIYDVDLGLSKKILLSSSLNSLMKSIEELKTTNLKKSISVL